MRVRGVDYISFTAPSFPGLCRQFLLVQVHKFCRFFDGFLVFDLGAGLGEEEEDDDGE